MAKLLKTFTVITGTYTNKNGERKNRYMDIGSIIETKNGPMGKIDLIPLKEGGWDGWFYINEPRERDEQPRQQKPQNDGFPPDDDIPF